MTLTKEHVGERIKRARENAQLTQQELAKLAGMERSALGKVEIGSRNVSGQEIERIAHALGQSPLELLSRDPLGQDPLSLFRSVTDEHSEENRRTVADCIALLREARQLERYLGFEEPDIPKAHAFGRMSNFSEAVLQGRAVARLERARLGLGHTPIQDIAELINQQGIRAAALPMVEEVSGLFIQDEALGTAILVNQNVSRVRRRFSYAHEYAHALLDRNEPSVPSSRQNAKQLREARANAFAAEFLVPEDGVIGLLSRLAKGEGARFFGALFSAADKEMFQFEERTDAVAQKVTIREVAILAHQFRVSVDVATYRLFDVGAIRRPEKEALLGQRESAHEIINALKLYDAEKITQNTQPFLNQQLVFLAIEALRRDRIPASRFRDVCILAGFPPDDLLDALDVVSRE